MTVAEVFPFSAILGQSEMQQALLIAATDPRVGGVLVFGERGTGKSTAVRSLATLLPKMRAVVDCPYNCTPEQQLGMCPVCASGGEPKTRLVPRPVVDLPLGATEDRVVGALDIERALAHGEKRFEPGLLARAHHGFLYIDEVNLLEDHLVDVLLDVAASGENVVEREGLSIRHPARFVLVGSGNPEEGELRPQLLDRFGLSVEVASPRDLSIRVRIVKLRDEFDRDPEDFVRRWKRKDAAVRRRIVKAQERVEQVTVPDPVMEKASALCLALGTDGLRGELTLLRSARALAALDGDDAVEIDHIARVAPSSLRHRLRRDPLDDVGSTVRIERAVAETLLP